MNIIRVNDYTIEALGDNQVLLNGERMKPEDAEKVLNLVITAVVSYVNR